MELAKWIVAFVAVYGFGGYVYDALIPSTAKQHQLNPAWPPHAKFHNAQTMLMGIGMGSLSLYLLFGLKPLTFAQFLVATAVAGMYFASMALATLFPGTAWSDPEFAANTPRPLGFHPQQLLGYILLALLAVAIALAAR